MRRPYEIYSKYKEILNKRLKKNVLEMTKVCPENCRHNKLISIAGHSTPIRICTFKVDTCADITSVSIIVCDKTQQAEECTAFDPNYRSREEAQEYLKKELEDVFKRREKYPEVVALEWVMDNELHDLRQKKPTRKHRLIFWLVDKLENMLR